MLPVTGRLRHQRQVKKIVRILGDEIRLAFYNKKPRDEDELKAVAHAISHCIIDPSLQRERCGARVADKECKFDFSLYADRDALEVKLISDSRRRNQIATEILEDIEAFKRSQFRNLLFLVYDSIGDIYDPAGFKRELEKSDHIHVIIVKH